MTLDTFTEEALQFRLQLNIMTLTAGKTPAAVPTAILLGGQSGAGKTVIHRLKSSEFKGNIIVIDGDSFRSQHPNYKELHAQFGKDDVEYTKEFAGKMVEALINELSQKGFNLLIEGTLRTSQVPLKTAQLLKSRNYLVHLAIMATKPELSYLSTLVRYEEMFLQSPDSARSTPKDHHDAIVHHLPSNVQELQDSMIFDSIQIYNRQKELLFDNDNTAIRARLESLLFGYWTRFEITNFETSLEKLNELSQQNHHDDEYEDYLITAQNKLKELKKEK
ncbi:zeta toxin family protein [Streptococcus devriesei]|uniref:zeta toxin family protein n=1 Tax=Streptococcus devriesei TaxID=231233 RepID=UPI00041EAC4F|nr:zeta toxin family protein [Streptococcus devriesei]